MVYRQSGANTVAVADAVVKRIKKISDVYSSRVQGFNISIIRD
jgi:multidrug efflux pump subunit AcrB